MIPELISLEGGPYRVLPPGVHTGSFAEVGQRFATNERREWLFEGLAEVGRALRSAGCGVMFLGGSFVTDKEFPGDFDGYWDPTGVIPSLLDPVLLDFEDEQAAQKKKFRGEMFIASESGSLGSSIKSLFASEKHTDAQVGVIRLKLRGAFS